ncbi:YbaK/EbsC family protein [uncultured Sulfitobacter sp.]|jgi:prolyl-tRNA editing enzyme YbaK/EbsC (Cys-tRNA(Pro) deacylase)|uniref:YbaK/EbsC family protein n=1 Tax=uncultured Sulfitobacter sp. TaxID=191468 RepID=UPI0030FB694D
MSKSVSRVERAISDLKLDASVERMPESTRTADDAAAACGCSVGQIVKSMIFEGVETGNLKLLLVSGQHDVDLGKAPELFGEPLIRADPKRVRSETGFAIGGVSPIGHLSPTETWIDAALLDHGTVWAAAGAPNAVFSVSPTNLKQVTNAAIFKLD